MLISIGMVDDYRPKITGKLLKINGLLLSQKELILKGVRPNCRFLKMKPTMV